MGYDPSITLLSLLIAIASSLFALWIVCQKHLSWRRLTAGALIMGAGVCSMHYTGMAAMRMTPAIQYDPPCSACSVRHRRGRIRRGAVDRLPPASKRHRYTPPARWRRRGHGLAIAGMHYTGHGRRARFPANSRCPWPRPE